MEDNCKKKKIKVHVYVFSKPLINHALRFLKSKYIAKWLHSMLRFAKKKKIKFGPLINFRFSMTREITQDDAACGQLVVFIYADYHDGFFSCCFLLGISTHADSQDIFLIISIAYGSWICCWNSEQIRGTPFSLLYTKQHTFAPPFLPLFLPY